MNPDWTPTLAVRIAHKAWLLGWLAGITYMVLHGR